MSAAAAARASSRALVWNLEAAAQLKAQVIEGFVALPKRGLEVGGLLLGQAAQHPGEPNRIEAICPVLCEHRHGPVWVLSETDQEAFSEILARKRSTGPWSVLGFYRSCTGRPMAPDAADLDLASRHFQDPSHVFLLVQPLSVARCDARAYAWSGRGIEPQGGVFDLDAVQTQVVETPRLPPVPSEPPVSKPPRSVGVPRPVKAHRAFEFGLGAVLVAAVLVLGALAIHLRTRSTAAESQPEQIAEVPALSGAAPELSATAARSQPQVLEVAPLRPIAAAPPPQPVRIEAERPARPPEPVRPPESTRPSSARPPQRIQGDDPALSEGIRNRLVSPLTVEVRVEVDAQGRVVSARPESYSEGLHRYLATRAAEQIRQWRYRPASTASGDSAAGAVVERITFSPPTP
jgi:hypothetical protein